MGETLVVDGQAHFTIASGNDNADALVTQIDGKVMELIPFGERLQVVQRVPQRAASD